MPGRFERVVEVSPVFPEDIVAALRIHAAAAEQRAGQPLFDSIDWTQVVGHHREPAIGDWIHILHAVLRRKARREATGEAPQPVTTDDFLEEVRRFLEAANRLAPATGTYV
jgi:hypothetical protein